MATCSLESDSGKDYMETTENTEGYSVVSDVFRDKLQRYRVFVEGRMDPNHGLVDRLLENDAIEYYQSQIINAETVPFLKSRKIVDFILEGNASEKIEKLCEALRETKQQHLVNYVEAEGVPNPQFPSDWPLRERETKIINKNVRFLTERMETADGLLTHMVALGTITQRQAESVSAHLDRFKRNEAFLEILRRGSLSDYMNTIKGLRETNQNYIAKVLIEGGSMVRLHATANGQVPVIKQAEAEIVNQLLTVLQGKTPEEKDRLLEIARLKALGLIDAYVVESICLFFYCKNLSDFLRLIELLESKELQEILEIIYNKFVSTSTKIEVTLTWTSDEFNEVKRILEEEREAGAGVSMDIGVQEFKRDKEEPEAGAGVSMDIGEKEVQSVLPEDELIAAIIRNNVDYFTEHIRPRSIINKLHNLGVIPDEQMRQIKTMQYDSEKTDEVLNNIRAAPIEDYHKFVQCLRETDQSLVADVAEKGGVVLKVTVTHAPTADLESIEKEIVEKLNQLQDKTVTKSDEVWRFLSQLKRADIEIVSSRWNKGIDVWLWCRSERALKTLKHPNMSEFVELGKKEPEESEFETFGIILNGLFSLLLSSGNNAPTISNVYVENPDKEAVCRKHDDFSEKEDKKLNVGERSVLSVAKLQDKIYLLCENPTAFVVYEGDLTDPSEELLVEGISTPVDMAFSSDSNCLYITDKGRASVWRISSPEYKVDIWLDSGAADPYTLSVTGDGRVVMAKRGSSPSLEIYHADARMLLHLVLPSALLRPNHAVETSKGNLVVSYDTDVGVPGGVCEITKEGQLISRFDSMFESISGVAENVNSLLAQIAKAKFFCFKYLAMDDKDQVYACDEANGELVVLDSRLKLEVIVGQGELMVPLRLQYLKEEKELMVIHGLRRNFVSILDAK